MLFCGDTSGPQNMYNRTHQTLQDQTLNHDPTPKCYAKKNPDVVDDDCDCVDEEQGESATTSKKKDVDDDDDYRNSECNLLFFSQQRLHLLSSQCYILLTKKYKIFLVTR